MEDHVLISKENGIGKIVFNRPDRMNALSPQMFADTIDTLQAWTTDRDVKCVVVTGAGKGFCAGGDVKAMNEGGATAGFTLEQKIDRQRGIHRLSSLLYHMPQVTIAAINGAAAGAGFGIALACDFRIASEKAKFTTAFAKVGLGGDFGITWPLARTLGEAKAKELLLLSDVIMADEAYRLGLVNRLVAPEAFEDAISEFAARIASGPTVSYKYMKENVRLSATSDYQAMLDREAMTHNRCSETEDHKEGAASFVEKRAPVFKGR